MNLVLSVLIYFENLMVWLSNIKKLLIMILLYSIENLLIMVLFFGIEKI